jgi:ankyrin repeat protein
MIGRGVALPLSVLAIVLLGGCDGGTEGRGVRPHERGLLWAALNNRKERVAELLDSGVDVDLSDPKTGATALSLASSKGNHDIVAMLVEHGADPNCGEPLYYAAVGGYGEVATLLLDSGADPNGSGRAGSPSPLEGAVVGGHVSVARLLVRRGGDVRRKRIGLSLLHMAAVYGRKGASEYLLAQGLDVDSRDSDGRTALLLAVQEKHTKVAEVLLAHGASPDTRDARGRSPISVAEESRHSELREMLRSARKEGGRKRASETRQGVVSETETGQ